MTAPIRPRADDALVRRIAALRRAGATDDEVEAFVTESEAPDFAGVQGGGSTTAPASRSPAAQRAYGRVMERRKAVGGWGNFDGMGQGVKLGDEIEAGVGALADRVRGEPFGESYRGRIAAEREGLQDYQQRHPVMSRVSETVGALATSLPAGPAALAKLPLAARATISGAAAGGLSGAGGADPDPTLSLKEAVKARVRGALGGATTGAVVGGVLGSAAGLAGKIANRGAPAAVARRDQQLLGALKRSGQSVDEMEAAARMRRAGGKPVALVDVLGKPGARLARDVTAFPTQGADDLVNFVEGRVQDMPSRMVEDLAKRGNITRISNTADAMDQLAKQADELATPLYDAVRHVPVADPRLRKLLALPDFQRAYGLAERAAANRAAAGQGTPLPPLGEAKAFTIGTLDQVKRAIDDILYAGKSAPIEAGGMGRTVAASLKTARDALVQIADDAAPKAPDGTSLYAAARDMFGGPTRMREMMDEAAEEFFKSGTTASDVTRKLAQLSAPEREAYRAVTLDQFANQVDRTKVGGNAALRFNSPGMLKKMRALFPDDASFGQWMQDFTEELGFGTTRNTVAVGSRTTPMAQGAAEIAGVSPGDIVSSVASGSPVPLLRGAVMRAIQGRLNLRTKATADALSQSLRAGQHGDQELFEEIARLRGAFARPPARPATPLTQAGIRTLASLFGGGR